MSAREDSKRLKEFDESIRVREGVEVIAGFDEAGRGPLCGPVVAAGCILPRGFSCPFIDDSKKLTPKSRKKAEEAIKEGAIAYAIEFVYPEEIDRINILEASRVGMERCLEKLLEKIKVEFLITDYMKLHTDIPTLSIPKGDATSQCVAAASILAKTARDEYMEKIALEYPEYGFEKHKGYPTKAHIEALEKYGVIEGLYRLTYGPVRKILKDTGLRR